jgi:erythromycin esterase
MKAPKVFPHRIALMLILGFSAAYGQELEQAQLEWLWENAIPLATTEAGQGFDDLMPLKELIGDARIVGLGEATRGTREFFTMKHRLVELLAHEMGFTLFAIEDNMPQAYRLNDYVLEGIGDPVELLSDLYLVWNTEEVLDLILWMREFNASGRGRMQFLGFDMQNPFVAMEIVADFMARADPDYLDELQQVYEAIETSYSLGGNVFDYRAWRDGAQALLEHLETSQAHYLESFPAEEVAWAIQNARILWQGGERASSNWSPAVRERSMVDNVEWILEHAPEGAKIVLWAHNNHVQKRPSWMGGHLVERYGDAYLAVGFALYEGSYLAADDFDTRWVLTAHEAGPARRGSVEWRLHQAGLPLFMLDLREVVPDSAESGWLAELHNLHSIGLVAPDGEYIIPTERAIVSDDYDLLIYIEGTTASRPLP